MVIVDSGFWIALIHRRDDYHVRAQNVLATIDEPLITTWCIITETCHILLKRTGNNAQQTFIHSLEIGAFEVFDLQVQDGKRIGELINQYSSLPMDLADASLIILAEHLGHGRILSVDFRDFYTYRWKSRHPFENLMQMN
ncbi:MULTISPECIES: type II toxin-antitoxin system VapC family toxin [Pseudanabaena]|uniref:PIN domain-containing protein n=2 Tax=Pseudanabaena TaxID=1152 RepID=L8N3E6_9CYAN|nr:MULTISPECIES: PIN domain-containing protein [Pseudanabaena]ELS32763.1 hypothetical protein Pse7429DRAFT_2469 [Pseudanabaena biceps PCC 7429]MDG3495017.1 PIN domain-containing protein [Pseudanabaena catenata USMAC16]